MDSIHKYKYMVYNYPIYHSLSLVSWPIQTHTCLISNYIPRSKICLPTGGTHSRSGWCADRGVGSCRATQVVGLFWRRASWRRRRVGGWMESTGVRRWRRVDSLLLLGSGCLPLFPLGGCAPWTMWHLCLLFSRRVFFLLGFILAFLFGGEMTFVPRCHKKCIRASKFTEEKYPSSIHWSYWDEEGGFSCL